MDLKERKEKLQELLNYLKEAKKISKELGEIGYLQNNSITPSINHIENVIDDLEVNTQLSSNGMSYELAEMLKECSHSKLGYYIGGGSYIKLEGDRIYLEEHPWSYYGGMNSSVVAKRDEITQFKAIKILKDNKKGKEEQKKMEIEREKELEKEKESQKGIGYKRFLHSYMKCH